jgi:hypothetical protein
MMNVQSLNLHRLAVSVLDLNHCFITSHYFHQRAHSRSGYSSMPSLAPKRRPQAARSAQEAGLLPEGRELRVQIDHHHLIPVPAHDSESPPVTYVIEL